ncbi:MAG: phosphonate C-P lyase system protein PhnG [Spirochaetales bacterium]|nr:phosphonate C-P lyase system protein PhnG [Spirochaetales bacterium]
MNRKERCRILIEGSGRLLKDLGEEIEKSFSVQTIDEPNEGVVMVRMRDSARKAPFYLGEVLVTEAKVQVDGAVGIGIIRGHHPKRAYRLALVDGAWNRGVPQIADWTKRLVKERVLIAREQEREEGRILKTRVDFSTMEDQGVEK